MPMIFEPDRLPVRHQKGTTYTTLADAAMLGVDALHVEHVAVEAGKTSDPVGVVHGERFVYVIRGLGRAQVGSESFPLGHESMLWIESGDIFTLEAGEEQLEVLVCRAPAE